MAAYADTYCALVGRARLQHVAMAGFEKSYSGMAGLGDWAGNFAGSKKPLKSETSGAFL